MSQFLHDVDDNDNAKAILQYLMFSQKTAELKITASLSNDIFHTFKSFQVVLPPDKSATARGSIYSTPECIK